jgi:transcriptional regulator with XRE-family HTH domain
MVNMTTGERIKEYRKKNNLTQSQLANKVNVSAQVVSNWEREYTAPSKDDIANLSKVLGVTADFLLGSTDNPTATADQNKLSKHNEINTAFHDFDHLTDEEKEYLETQLEIFRKIKEKNTKERNGEK